MKIKLNKIIVKYLKIISNLQHWSIEKYLQNIIHSGYFFCSWFRCFLIDFESWTNHLLKSNVNVKKMTLIKVYFIIVIYNKSLHMIVHTFQVYSRYINRPNTYCTYHFYMCYVFFLQCLLLSYSHESQKITFDCWFVFHM